MPALPSRAEPTAPAADAVGLAWLVTVRWTTLLAEAGALIAGRSGLDASIPVGPVAAVLAASAASNVWLMWHVRSGRGAVSRTTRGVFVCADVLLLSWLLLRSGGALNPASVFYLVQIVVAALVLGRTWTWIVTTLSVCGYAALFLTPTAELRAAQMMHPEIAVHMRGMWLAFALTAPIIGMLVTRLAIAIERRDEALDRLRDRTARASRLAGLVTLAAGAAHELRTPLATIAVAAHELERSLDRRPGDADLRSDVRLISAEVDRCHHVLAELAGRAGEAEGAAPRVSALSDVLSAVLARLTPADRDRVHLRLAEDPRVTWPVETVAPAIANLIRNGLQASTEGTPVEVVATCPTPSAVRIVTVDRGAGMTPETLGRAGEPFFTTKAPGAGTGLGLFVTRSTVEQLGGRLTLDSRPGLGTTATIMLPADVVTGPPSHE